MEQQDESHPTTTRRQFLRTLGGATAAAGLGSTAGCLDILFGPQGAGSVPGADMTYRQDVSREDATVEVASVSELAAAASSGEIVWVHPGQYDLTGRNLTVRNGTVIASGRGGGGGAVLTTTDQGTGSPSRSHALLNIEDGRVTGVTIRGPLYNYTLSDIIPGYVPFAPGNGAERSNWRGQRVCRGVSIQHDAGQIDNCEIWGWSTGIMVGARQTAVSPTISHCFVHNCMMMSLGYCVDVKRGTPLVNKCRFNAYRHAVNGYGTADAGYRVRGCVFGPHVAGHHVDMHRVGENEDGSSARAGPRWAYRAGGTMVVQGCTILGTRRVGPDLHNGTDAGSYEPGSFIWGAGGSVPAVRIRGVPADGFYFEGNRVEHQSPTAAIQQTGLPGSVDTDANGWYRMFVSGNQWGVQISPDNAGAGVGNRPQSGRTTDGAVFHENFENGATDYLNVNGGYVPNYDSAVLTTNQAARVGQHALRIHIDHDWDFPNTGGMPGVKPLPKNDGELRSQGICQWGEPFWYGFSLGIPANWQPDGLIEQVQEFHRDTSDGMDPAAGGGEGKPISTRIDGTQLRFLNGWSDGNVRSDPVTIQAGNWYDIVMHLNWTHSGMNETGFARAWVNGEQVMDYSGPTAAQDGDPPRPAEVRIYKWAWDGSSPDNRTRTYYFDEIRYANAGGSYEDVVPGTR